MATVAVERDVELELDIERVDDRSAAARRVPREHAWPWPERLLLRLMRWDWQHPHGVYLRTQHKVAMVLFRLGLGRFDDDTLMTTIGRKSGLPRRVVVSAVAMDDRRYVVNPFGERAHWYRNLAADPIVTVQQRGRTWTARATRVTDRDEAISLYEQTPGATGSTLRWLFRARGIAETASSSPRSAMGWPCGEAQAASWLRLGRSAKYAAASASAMAVTSPATRT